MIIVWPAFLLASFAISAVPWAHQLLGLRTAYQVGPRLALLSVVCRLAAFAVMVVLVSAGLGTLLIRSEQLFTAVKWIGVAYLFYLAVRQWRTATVDLREQIGKAMHGGRLSLVVRGFLVNATNPKGLVFFLAVLPQFVVPTAPLLPQYLAIGVTMVTVDLVVMGLYTALAVRLLAWMHTPRKQTVVNRVFSGLFATAAVVLSLVRRGPATA